MLCVCALQTQDVGKRSFDPIEGRGNVLPLPFLACTRSHRVDRAVLLSGYRMIYDVSRADALLVCGTRLPRDIAWLGCYNVILG